MPRARRFTTRGEPSRGTLPRPRVALPGSWVPALAPGCRDGGRPRRGRGPDPLTGRPASRAAARAPCLPGALPVQCRVYGTETGAAGAESSLPGHGRGEGRAERSCGSGGEPCGGSRSGGSAGRGRARGKGCDSTRNTVLIFCMSEGAAPTRAGPEGNTQCAGGGIGRRAGFRFQCPKGRGGSTPPSRTMETGSPSGRKFWWGPGFRCARGLVVRRGRGRSRCRAVSRGVVVVLRARAGRVPWERCFAEGRGGGWCDVTIVSGVLGGDRRTGLPFRPGCGTPAPRNGPLRRWRARVFRGAGRAGCGVRRPRRPR